MIYNSYNELKNNILKENDLIIFNVNNKSYKYMVKINFLHYQSNKISNNDLIFKLLNIKNKYSFCSKYYKYNTSQGDFPISVDFDYKALTRVALELLKLCDNDIWD